jgi:Na+/melibiose symporter-like transporter
MLTALGMLVVAVAGQQVLQRRKKRPDSARQPFDLAGAVLFSGLLTAGLLTLTLGPRVGWSDPYAICGTAIFLALVAAFVWTERRHPAPMLDFALLRNGEFAMGALSAVVAFMCISAMRFLAPFFFQGVKGFSPQQVGLLMLPAAMIMALSAPLVGRLADRLGVRLVANVGLSVAGIGLALFTAIQLQTPTWGIVAALVVMGLGMASFSAPNSASILNAVGAEAHGVASGIVNLCRNTGNIIGIAFGTAVVTLTMGRAGFPASLSAVGLDAEAGLLESFTSGVQITALVLVTVLVPVLALVVGWTVRRSRR